MNIETICKVIKSQNIEELKTLIKSFESKKHSIDILLCLSQLYKKEVVINKVFMDFINENILDINEKNKLILSAAHFNSVDSVKFLLSQEVNINYANKSGNTALFMATMEGNYDIVKLLIDHGADINNTNNENASVLQEATEQGNINIIKLLVDNGANIYHEDNNGFSILIYSVLSDNIELVKYFIDKGADVKSDNKILNFAIENNNIDLVRLLVENGANVNCCKDNLTPAMSATRSGSLIILRYLLKEGADINLQGINGLTPLMYAVIDMEKVQLLDNISNHNILKKATKRKFPDIDSKIKIVQYLIENEANVNIQNNTNFTAYNIALHFKNVKALKLLRESGASTLKNKDNIFIDFFEIIIFLINIGYKKNFKESIILYKVMGINILDSYIKSLFTKEHFLSKLNEIKLFVSCFKEKIFGIKVENDDADYLLHEIQKGNVDALKIIMNDFSNINLDFLLIKFIKEDFPYNIIKKITLNKNTSFNFQDNEGNTALYYVVEKNKIDIAELILKDGIDINIKNKRGLSALDICDPDSEMFDLMVSYQNINEYSPQKIVKILTNFTEDKPMKFTTHNWDFGDLNKSVYINFDGYMNAVKLQWDSIKDDLEVLSPNLYKKVYNFLWEPDSNVAIGWSSMDGLKEWCDSGKKPFDFKNFNDVITTFKKEIEIRKDYNMLKSIFIQERKKLKKTFKKYQKDASVKLIKLEGQTFYTDTEKFKSAISTIFSQMSEGLRPKYPNITVECIGDSIKEFIELKITQIDSVSQSSAEVMLKETNSGNFKSIKENLKNLCDWSIESSFDDSNYRVNYLKSNNIEDIEELEYKPVGFTHILRFYNK